MVKYYMEFEVEDLFFDRTIFKSAVESERRLVSPS